ncbi:right-handed parallel beta-helix repeat-containing protein [Pedobacter cryoconitis]|uniref:right-handed parallel beta-helix repeat-containing protein n=1 Tax=Pedobacter cryoconitis TaxID=188932 RepID=UPI001622B2EE|nr:right-handed parallel beta-helix repeat-containing protein [Pedobacter cryoconitis]MBB5643792.1 hypothetical protein [Pedobacter cryoconitis]
MQVNSITDLINTIDPAINKFNNVLGYYSPGDNGGGDFYWDSSCTEVVNNGTVLSSVFTTSGRWKRVISGETNVKWFGARGNGSNDSVHFKNAIDTGKNIYVPEGIYSVSGLVLKLNQVIYGQSTLSELHAIETDKPLLTITRFGGVSQLTLYSSYYVSDINFCAIKVLNEGYNVICEKLRIVGGFTNAINCSGSSNVNISNNFISGMMGPQIFISYGTHNIIENNKMEKCRGTSFIKLMNAASVIIKHNYIGGGDTDRPGAQGIYAETVPPADHKEGDPFYHYTYLVIDSNDIDNIGGQAVAIKSCFSVKIKGNWFSAGRTNGVSSVLLNDCKRIDISGNDIYTSGYMGLQITDCEVGSITNNQIEMSKDTGVFLLRSRLFSITGNQIGNLTGLEDGYGGMMKVGVSENQGDNNIISNNIFRAIEVTNLYHEGSNNIVNDNIFIK